MRLPLCNGWERFDELLVNGRNMNFHSRKTRTTARRASVGGSTKGSCPQKPNEKRADKSVRQTNGALAGQAAEPFSLPLDAGRARALSPSPTAAAPCH